MFNVTGDFSKGIYSTQTGKVNGFQGMVMQTEEEFNKIVECFEALIAAGYNPANEAIQKTAFSMAGVDPTNVTVFNKKRLERKVNEIWETYQTRR